MAKLNLEQRDNEKLEQLAEYLGVSKNKIDFQENERDSKYNEFIVKGEGTFYVMTEEESREAVYDNVEGVFDDLGLESFTPSFQETILSDYLKDGWFEDVCKEYYESYASDIQEETGRDFEYGNRLNDECVEHKLIDPEDIVDGEYEGEEDLVELLSNYLYEDVLEHYSSYAEWYRFDFGTESLNHAISEGYVDLDMDGIVDECIEVDGYGHFIASYDGETIELKNFYAYKIDS